jgi:hypothetical protein
MTSKEVLDLLNAAESEDDDERLSFIVFYKDFWRAATRRRCSMRSISDA